jgi:hypothetical protein
VKKDLMVLTADLDALAVIKEVLARPDSLGIRAIDFAVDRHTGRDAGMVQSGPELARRYKSGFEKLILLWDHEGSGWERRATAELAEAAVLGRLDGVTWKDASAAIALRPELEEWLWHNVASLRAHFAFEDDQLQSWSAELAGKLKVPSAEIKTLKPKELFEYVVYIRLRRTISPRDFASIAKRASLHDWQRSPTFRRLVAILRGWFPP